MMTHKYRFPAFGSFDKGDEKKAYVDTLQKNLTDSPDCLGAWCVFPTEGDILDKVTMEEDSNGKISSVTLHTYQKIWDGCEGDLRDCVADCLRATSDEHYMGQPVGATIEGDVEYLGQWDDNRKHTYKYQFPASGKASDMPAFAASKLEGHLNEGYDCLGAYCMFDTHSKTLDHVSFDVDNTGNVTTVNIHTYTELWEGNEKDFRDCVETNLAKVTDAIKIDGDVKVLGIEGTCPETLYHITEEKNLDDIMEKGLVPMTGKNNYKNMEDYVYLASEQDIAPWLSILKNVEKPVIIEVNTSGLTGIEQGRVFTTDRSFTPQGYGEYRTQDIIPPSALTVKQFSRDDDFGRKLCDDMARQLENVQSENKQEWQEVMTGIERLEQMGIITDQKKTDMLDTHKNPGHEAAGEKTAMDEDEGLPWDKNDNGRTPAWDDEKAFADAVRTIPEDGKQMTLADYGMKI